MAHTIPTIIPASVRAGDTITWKRSLPDYRPADGWSLAYVLVKAGSQVTFNASASGDAHLVEVALSTSTGWSPGVYAYQERATNAGKTYTTAEGSIEILPGFAAATAGLDARSHAQRTLAALEAWIEGHDPAVAEYEIAGRRMKYIAITDLLKLRDQYRREVRAQSGKSGRVYMRF